MDSKSAPLKYFERATGRGEVKKRPYCALVSLFRGIALECPYCALASLLRSGVPLFPLLCGDSEIPLRPIVSISVASHGFFFCLRFRKFRSFSWPISSPFPQRVFRKAVSHPHEAVFIFLRNRASTATLS